MSTNGVSYIYSVTKYPIIVSWFVLPDGTFFLNVIPLLGVVFSCQPHTIHFGQVIQTIRRPCIPLGISNAPPAANIYLRQNTMLTSNNLLITGGTFHQSGESKADL